MDKVGGAFETLTGSGDNTNQSQPPSSSTTTTTADASTTQEPSSTATAGGGVGILSTLSDKISGLVGAGKGQAAAEEPNTNTSESESKVADPVDQAGDETVGEFIRHQYKSSAEDIPADVKASTN